MYHDSRHHLRALGCIVNKFVFCVLSCPERGFSQGKFIRQLVLMKTRCVSHTTQAQLITDLGGIFVEFGQDVNIKKEELKIRT